MGRVLAFLSPTFLLCHIFVWWDEKVGRREMGHTLAFFVSYLFAVSYICMVGRKGG